LESYVEVAGLSFLRKLFGFRKGEGSEVEVSQVERRRLVLPEVFRPREKVISVRLVQGRVVEKASPMVTVESEVCSRCKMAGRLRLVVRAPGRPWLCLFSCEQPCSIMVKVDLSSLDKKMLKKV